MVGSPQSPGIPAWQRTAAPSSKTLSFGKGTKVGEDAQGEEATGERSTLDDHSHLNGEWCNYNEDLEDCVLVHNDDEKEDNSDDNNDHDDN